MAIGEIERVLVSGVSHMDGWELEQVNDLRLSEYKTQKSRPPLYRVGVSRKGEPKHPGLITDLSG